MKTSFRSLLTAFAGLFFLTQSASASAEAVLHRVEGVPDQPLREDAEPRDNSNPALWLVSDHDTQIYLFGTIHILRPGLNWFDDAVAEAFDKSDEVVLEVIEPDDNSMQMTMIKSALSTDGTPLRARLDETERSSYDAALAKLGMPAATFDSYKPWFAAVSLGAMPLLQAGYDLDSGAERTITLAARKSGKRLGQLETVEQQIGYFNTLSKETQLAYLDSVISSMDTVTEDIDELVRDWSAGDAVGLAKQMNEGLADPALRTTLLTERNVNWANWIEKRLEKPGTVFVAVGAGHLAGPDSVQQQLAQMNIAADRVEY